MLVYITARGQYFVPELSENGLFNNLLQAQSAVRYAGEEPVYTWDTDTEM